MDQLDASEAFEAAVERAVPRPRSAGNGVRLAPVEARRERAPGRAAERAAQRTHHLAIRKLDAVADIWEDRAPRRETCVERARQRFFREGEVM